MSVEQKVDEIKEVVDKLYGVLAGDEFNDGLVKDHRTLKERFYETREQVRKIWIIGSVIVSVLSTAIGLLSIFIS